MRIIDYNRSLQRKIRLYFILLAIYWWQILNSEAAISVFYDYENDKIEFNNNIFNYEINDKTLILESENLKYVFNKQ